MTTTEIPVTQGLHALVDEADLGLVLDGGPGWCAHWERYTFYAVRQVPRPGGERTTQRMHKLLTGYPETDHVNRDGLDNRRANLREATRQQNQRNRRRRSDNTSGFIGVSWRKDCRRWQAYIQGDGPRQHIGYFDNRVSAALAYDNAARAIDPEFFTLNFPA